MSPQECYTRGCQEHDMWTGWQGLKAMHFACICQFSTSHLRGLSFLCSHAYSIKTCIEPFWMQVHEASPECGLYNLWSKPRQISPHAWSWHDAFTIPWKERKERCTISSFQRVTFQISLPGGLIVKNPPASAGDARGSGSVPQLGRSPAGGHGNLL